VGLVAVALAASSGGALVVRAAQEDRGNGGDVGVAPAAEAGPIDLCMQASLEERAGLVLVVGLPGVTSADDPLVDRLAEVGVGGVMLRDENILDEEQAQELVAGLRDRLGSHLLVAVDDEGGRVSAMGALGLSVTSARRLGQRGPEAAEAAGRALGALAASIDVDWVFAPVADLDDGTGSGVIGDRSFGADPDEVAATAGAFARGLRAKGRAVTAKHFPGHGGTGDPHLGDAVNESSLAELEARDLIPFRALIADDAEAVMMSHGRYPGVWGDLPASLEPNAYQLLRAQGFDGVAITDALGMGAVHARFGFDVAPAIAVSAGADAVLVTQGEQVEVLRDGLVTAVRDGWLSETRLADAVGRVLALRGQQTDGTVCRV
jgi:beta-N-acetylhexosaminidase